MDRSVEITIDRGRLAKKIEQMQIDREFLEGIGGEKKIVAPYFCFCSSSIIIFTNLSVTI